MTPAAAPITTAAALAARTREVEPRADLLDALGTGGFAWIDGSGTSGRSFVTAGVVARVAPSAAVAFLRSIAAGPGDRHGPVAVGALPFADPGSAHLTVPARIERIDADGRAWVTEIAPTAGPAIPTGGPPGVDPAAATAPAGPGRPDTTDRERWTTAVEAALAEIASGRLSKVVLARDARFDAGSTIDRATVLRRLRSGEPGCFVYADGDFLGASPELLVRRAGGSLVSRPMAGTVPVGDGAPAVAAETLLRSGKDRWEHELVVESVVRTFERLGARPVRVDGPDLARLATVAHLATRVEAPVGAPREGEGGRSRGDEVVDAGPDAPSAVDAALALHPTPAVGGTPTGAALALIGRLEPCGRGRYAGPVGWVDAAGDGEFAVAIRSADVSGRHARMFAGAGIVAGSDAGAEWDETEAKLGPMRRALGTAPSRPG